MGEFIAPWNLLQLSLIAIYPMYLSFIRIVSGMSLLALYVELLIVCVPVLFIQMKLGGYHQKGIVGLFSQHVPIAKGIGVALLIDLFLTCVYLAPLISHVGMYAMMSMVQSPYMWEGCDNVWNTPQCYSHTISSTTTTRAPVITLPEQEFFDNMYLQVNPSISNITEFPVWKDLEAFQNIPFSLLPIAVICTWFLVFLFIALGPRVCGWILFILGPGSLALLFAVMGYGYKNLDPQNTGKFLKQFYKLDFRGFVDFDANHSVIQDWVSGTNLLMLGLPVWTAIPSSMGKWVGRGRISRNINWLVVVFVYACVVQVPQLAMAPYLGNLLATSNVALSESMFKGFKVVFNAMPAAFAMLNIPPVYAMLFFLSMFIAGLMFLCIAVMTIVDNVVESLQKRYVSLADRKCCTYFLTSLIAVLILMGLGVLHMSKIGVYLIVMMDQSVSRLRFIIVILLAISLILVYVKQSFSIGERVIISIWCGLASISAAGLWIYSFQLNLGTKIGYGNVYLQDVWELVSWVVSAIPYIAIPAAVLHSCMYFGGSCSERTHYLMCGSDEDDRHTDYDGYYPAPEPTAPPYYMHNDEYLYPMNDLAKSYDPETEPLNTNLRHTNM